MANGTFHKVAGRRIQVYTPTVGLPEWHGRKLTREEKPAIRARLRTGMVTTHEDYQALMSYLHMINPLEMDGLPSENGNENVAIQWDYRGGLRKQYNVHDDILNKDYPVYAFVIYDTARDNEPVLVGGSFFEETNNNGLIPDGPDRIVVGDGIVLFASPDYRLGLGSVSWNAEAALYRELGIRFQKDIQNSYSLKTTLDMFKNKDSIKITSQGRLKSDGSRAQIRILMDYTDPQLIEDWEEVKDEPVYDYHHEYDVDHLLEREGLTREELRKPWTKR
jgi:hypothetical protein